MDIVQFIQEKAKSLRKTIVLPEYNDTRVVKAVEIVNNKKIANAILLTEDKIDAGKKEKYIEAYFELRKAKGLTIEEARGLFKDPLYYAAMMTRYGEADGFVAGASHTTADIARAAIHCLEVEPRINIASSCFIMVVPDCSLGEKGIFVFADCGIVPEPNARQLACIAITAAEMASKVIGIPPKVALLSYSTKGSAKTRTSERIREALALAKTMAPDMLIDGELQLDAAVEPEVARIKCPDSPLEGKANVLIFPNLEAGNIGYKLVQRLAKAHAIGPLFLGLNKPCSDLSRGCFVEDIVDCVAVTAIRAQ